ncbi:MAG: DNA mismatch repair endonuclease MutL [Nitrospina sp.]|jgi:DNA mismatch repair protein MutL|nr:DNA mismatch repair endonuclease MutL [Nitrospina sp.]MBT6718302.1 DNA mismatch repair endonuclease MutL [Nitrospina sp.]
MPTSTDTNKPQIRVLSDDLANQIAAGEVVERPASVVKELVENSIDAGATLIRLDIEGGGKKKIRIMDNGMGMLPEECKIAFSRHATSKISEFSDLETIQSLGFRGEALPSIASVAKVRCTSARSETQGGKLIVVEGGALIEEKDFACPQGTTIEVAQLFYVTPARSKFLKGDSTEFSHITQVVTQQALAYPAIQFQLTHNGRDVIQTLPTDQIHYRIAELFGADLSKSLVQVQSSSGDYRLDGYVSNPVFTRSNRSAQYCFINGRFVRDKVILHATQQGYSHLLPKGQHPALFLYLTMDPKLLDVNVHPSKAEVRFAFQQDVHQFVSRSIREALERNLQSPVENVRSAIDDIPISSNYETPAYKQESPSWASRFNEPSSVPQQGNLSEALRKMTGSHGFHSPVSSSPQQVMGFDKPPVPVANLIYSEFEPLGQLESSFIIMQGKKGLLVVDQHVAHERILYERFREAAKEKRIEVQNLLFPLTVEFSPAETEILTPHLDRLKELGLELEIFGKNEFLLRSVPAILKNIDNEKLLRDTLEILPKGGDENILHDKYEDVLIMMSCRNAIKVNHPLNLDQIRKLISDLEQTTMPFTCPHGRPISLLFDMDDILKKFLRK